MEEKKVSIEQLDTRIKLIINELIHPDFDPLIEQMLNLSHFFAFRCTDVISFMTRQAIAEADHQTELAQEFSQEIVSEELQNSVNNLFPNDLREYADDVKQYAENDEVDQKIYYLENTLQAMQSLVQIMTNPTTNAIEDFVRFSSNVNCPIDSNNKNPMEEYFAHYPIDRKNLSELLNIYDSAYKDEDEDEDE